MKRRLFYLIPLLTFVFLTLSTTLVPQRHAYAADPTASHSPDFKCPTFDLDWFFCKIMDAMTITVGVLDDFINKQMSIGTDGDQSDPNQIFCNSKSTGNAIQSCTGYHNAWSSIRYLALGLMGIAAVVVLIAQALGFEFLDAYTIRKVLPRFLICAVVISLSWQLMQFFVTLSNDLAYGIRFLIYQPFSSFPNATLTGGSGFIGSLLSLGALTALGWIGLLSYLGTALIAVFIAILVLVLRQLVIIMLIIIAPIAIVMYILPNTQKYYKVWWESFSKALLMFALISALIAIGRVFTSVSALNSTNPIAQLAGATAYFLPYFLIPATFKFAGSAISNIGGMVQQRGSGAFGALKQYRGRTAQKNMQDLKTGNRLHGEQGLPGYGGFAKRFNVATRNIANLQNAGYTPWRARERMRAAGGAAILQQANEAPEKNQAFKILLGQDDVMEAALYEMQHGGGEGTIRDVLRERGFEPEMVNTMVGSYHNARNSMGTEAFNTALAVHSFGTSSGWTPRYQKNAQGNYINADGVDIGGEESNPDDRALMRGSGGAGEARAALDYVAGNDRVRMVGMLGQARQQAESKGRFDLVGGSFTQDVDTMEKYHSNYSGGFQGVSGGQKGAIKTLTSHTHAGALDGQARYRLATGHRRSMDALAPEMRSRITSALYQPVPQSNPLNPASVEKARAQSKENADQAMAQLAFAASSLDAASNGSPENARVIKQTVLDQKVKFRDMNNEVQKIIMQDQATAEWAQANPEVSIGQLVERMRRNPDFIKYRREYGTAEDADAGTRSAEAANPHQT